MSKNTTFSILLKVVDKLNTVKYTAVTFVENDVESVGNLLKPYLHIRKGIIFIQMYKE